MAILWKAFQAHSRAVGIQEEITVCYLFLPVLGICELEWTAVFSRRQSCLSPSDSSHMYGGASTVNTVLTILTDPLRLLHLMRGNNPWALAQSDKTDTAVS